MTQTTQHEKMLGAYVQPDRGGLPPLFLYDDIQNMASNFAIRDWCSRTDGLAGSYNKLVQVYNGLAPGQRVYHSGLMHGGFLHEGKSAVIVKDDAEPSQNRLLFMLPTEVGDNPGVVKNLPIPPENLITGDEEIANALESKLITQPFGGDSVFAVHDYTRVARTMRSLGWDVASPHKDISTVKGLRQNIREFTEYSAMSWLDGISRLPNSLLVSLLELSAMLGDQQEQRTIDTIAKYVAELSGKNSSDLGIGEKAVAAYTAFSQRSHREPLRTRQKSRELLINRGNFMLAGV